VLDPAELLGADVVIVGAPVDESTSTRPGARFGPRAIRHADDTGGVPPARPHLDVGIDPFAVLRVVDHGDVEVVAGDPERNLAALGAAVGRILDAGAIPIVLGGDHSIAYPDVRAASERFDALRLVQLDAHADTSAPGEGRPRWSHGSPIRLLVEEGLVPGAAVAQVGLRGWWPPPEDLNWARERGIRWTTMAEVDDRGLGAVLDEVVAATPPGARLWLSVDVDAADPAYAPGTGTPEPGGFTSRELLAAVLRLTRELELGGMEVVEVSPPYDHAEITAMLAHRLVLTALTGLASRR
jgi:agmatinase